METTTVPHEPYIETFTGKKFHFLNPTKEEFDIIDISSALANQCRFTGHVRQFYSVAEHSILTAAIVKEWGGTIQQQLQALMHDGTEAYLTDVASPVKPFLDGYKPLEKALWGKLAEAFEIPVEFFDIVKKADLAALLVEAEYLMPSKGHDWTEYGVWKEKVGELPKIAPLCLPPRQARMSFMRVFDTLAGTNIVSSLFVPNRELLLPAVANG